MTATGPGMTATGSAMTGNDTLKRLVRDTADLAAKMEREFDEQGLADVQSGRVGKADMVAIKGVTFPREATRRSG